MWRRRNTRWGRISFLSLTTRRPLTRSPTILKVIPAVDAIYMTRLQDEWDRGDPVDIDIERFSFQKRHLDLLKADGIIMHPLPCRQEIAVR